MKRIIKAVNITKNHENQLSYYIAGQQVQFEFDFCESMPEQIVKNLIANARTIDVNSLSYENSPVIPHIIHNTGSVLHVLRRKI